MQKQIGDKICAEFDCWGNFMIKAVPLPTSLPKLVCVNEGVWVFTEKFR
ncbi:MAG: hypothetical protein ACPLZF_01505 [Nitrososphaeria archaeon]